MSNPETIWKYELTGSLTTIELPADAKVLCVQVLYDVPSIWVQLDPTAETQLRTFRAFATGRTFRTPEQFVYIGTYQETHDGGVYPLHLYEFIGGQEKSTVPTRDQEAYTRTRADVLAEAAGSLQARTIVEMLDQIYLATGEAFSVDRAAEALEKLAKNSTMFRARLLKNRGS